MITVDIKSLLGRMNFFLTRCMETAAGHCVSRAHYEVTVEHLLAKLVEEPQADVAFILRQFDIDPGKLAKAIDQVIDDFKTGNSGKPVFSPMLIEWLQEAWLIGSVNFSEPMIRSGSLLMALLKNPLRFASGRTYIDIISAISADRLLKEMGAVTKLSIEEPKPGERAATTEDGPRDKTALARFCVDFTRQAKEGKIDPVFGRDREIRQMIDILARRRKNNPIAVGEPGVGKTAVVEGLALRIVLGDVPSILKDVTLLGLDMGLLQAGAGMKGEFENRLKSVINEVKSSVKPIILFIDEAHTLIGAGGSAGGSDAANLLKPALARGELRTIAATTWAEYKKYFEKDAAMARRFQLVHLDEPSEKMTVLILRGLKEKYEETHGVIVRDDAVVTAAELSNRYISGRQLPDKAVDLLDTSAARVKILLTAKPGVVEDRERKIQALEREKKAISRDKLHGLAVDENRISEIGQEIDKETIALEELKSQWLKEQEIANQLIADRKELFSLKNEETMETGENKEAREAQISALEARVGKGLTDLKTLQGASPMVKIEVDPDVVSHVVSDWTGIPLGNVMRDEAQNILNLETSLKARIKGQDHAISQIVQVIKNAKAGVKDPSQPLGVFLLAGPSGVGKTETGLALADLMFGGERFMVSINMSEFQEKHTVSRLIGSPPGYVGYGEGGVLTEAVRQRPYSVVLLDEVEKSHPEVMNLFYQVFDKGVLSDGEGRVIDFKNTLILLTSNLGTDVITELCSGEEAIPLESVTQAIRPLLSNHFKPALLARMHIAPYVTLNKNIMKEIVSLKLDKLVRRLAETHKMTLVYSQEVVDKISERCIEVETGARNIDHIMNGTILPMMSQEILSRMSEGDLPSEVFMGIHEDGSFKIDFGETHVRNH